MRFAWLAVAASAATLSFTSDASANGRFPAANQIFFRRPTRASVGVRTTFGILLSHDGGTTWTWLCEDILGLGPTTTEDPPIAMTAGGSLIAALSFGVDVSSDVGCDWGFAGGPLSGQVIKDIALRPGAPHAVVAVTGTYEAIAGEGGTSGYAQQVYETVDDGAHWSPLGLPIDPSALVTTIDVAASDPNRLYASAIRHSTTPPSASLFVSTDAGASWTERPVPFDPNRSTAIFIAAVDPTNADLVYVRSDVQSQLFVTNDAGKTWSMPLSLEDPMLGFALSSDGSQVYAGSATAGLFAASAASLSFTQMSSIHVQCLAANGNDLWACSDEPSGFIVGQSRAAGDASTGAAFAPKLPNLIDIHSPIACPPGAGAGLCTSFDYDASPPHDPFSALCTSLNACLDMTSPALALTAACTSAGHCDAGPGDAGPLSKGPSSASCGCSVVGGQGAAGLLVASPLLFLAARRRTRRRAAR